MAGPTRTKLERERDLQRIAERYLRGRTQAAIGEALGVSQSQISRDLKTLRARWLESSLRDFDEARALELVKLDEVEAQWWRQWERSTEDGQPGAERYLRGVERCIEQRRKLLGFDAPSKIAPTDPTGDKPHEPLTDTERAERLSALLGRAMARRERQEALSASEQGD